MVNRFFLSFGLLCLITTGAAADSFSFTGNFQTDDDVQLFTFTIASNQTVTFLTLSYAGGTNFAGSTISPGGFDPLLTLFDSEGNEINFWDNSPGQVPNGPDGALDAYDSELRLADTYTLALTESPNQSVDGTLVDGFNGGGNQYGCTFCDSQNNQLDSHWAVDILTVDSASQVGGGVTPEPGSLILLSSGLGCFSWIKRRKLFRSAIEK